MNTPAKSLSPRAVSRRPRAAAPKPRVGGRSARVVSEVLTATLEVFGEQGYAGLSVEEVAARAGVNKTTIYRRWPTKAELVGAALYSMRDEDPPPPDTGSLEQDLLVVLERMATSLATPRKRAIMNSLVLGNSEPELRALLRRMREERPAIPQLIFERALARGEIPKGSNTQLISSALLGPLHTLVMYKREQVERPFLKALLKLVITGAAADGARP